MCGGAEDTHNEDGALAWVQHTHGLVLAGGENLGAVPVPAGAVDEVGVNAVHPHHGLPAGHVPQDQHVVAACEHTAGHKAGTSTQGSAVCRFVKAGCEGRSTCAQQHVVGGGVPAQDADALGVAFQLDHGFRERRGQPAVRDLPNLSGEERNQDSRRVHNTSPSDQTERLCYIIVTPTMTLQSSEPLAMMLSL